MNFRFKFQVGPEQWSALPCVFKVGELATKFVGHTYGLDRDDMQYLGIETIPIINGEGFFTCPVVFLEDNDGVRPVGAYQKFSPRKSR